MKSINYILLLICLLVNGAFAQIPQKFDYQDYMPAGTLTQTSDLRLKQDLQPLQNSLDKLYELKGYHYHWKDKTRSQALQTGLVAQEVEAVFPELVETDKDGFKSVNYIALIPHLLEAIKELKQENAALRKASEATLQDAKRWELLERKMEQMEARLRENNKPN